MTDSILNNMEQQQDYYNSLTQDLRILEFIMIHEYCQDLEKNSLTKLFMHFTNRRVRIVGHNPFMDGEPYLPLMLLYAQADKYKISINDTYAAHQEVINKYTFIMEADNHFVPDSIYNSQFIPFDSHLDWVKPFSFAVDIPDQTTHIQNYRLNILLQMKSQTGSQIKI